MSALRTLTRVSVIVGILFIPIILPAVGCLITRGKPLAERLIPGRKQAFSPACVGSSAIESGIALRRETLP
jgi:hypothetical protein